MKDLLNESKEEMKFIALTDEELFPLLDKFVMPEILAKCDGVSQRDLGEGFAIASKFFCEMQSLWDSCAPGAAKASLICLQEILDQFDGQMVETDQGQKLMLILKANKK